MTRNPNELPAVLLSKLHVPQPTSGYVSRHHLIDRLNDGLACKATFLTAPAGYGKSTLLGEWVRQLNMPVGWLSLDAKDNDLIRFWSGATKAIEKALGGLSDSVRDAASALSPGRYEPFLVALLNELDVTSEPIALVLDDWHAIGEREIADSVSYFLEYLPPSVHLVISSRTPAGIAKARWISRDWMLEIDAEQLRFDVRETADFFRLFLGRELPRERIEEFIATTEGWVTGLKLIALSMRNSNRTPASFGHSPTESRESVERFLLEEVYGTLDEPMRDFLLNVSVLERMNGPLCEAVGGENGADKLARLAEMGLFLIPLDDRKEWFRFHHLFGEFLRKRQSRRDPADTKSLYRAAAASCESQGLPEEAVDYHLAAGEYTEAIRLLERMRSVMIRREFQALKTWLSAIPERHLVNHPYLYFSYIFSLLWAQDVELAERHLRRSEQYIESSSARWSEEEKNRYLGYLYFVRNFKATQYDMDMIKGLEYIRLSLQYSPQGTDLIFASPYMPLAPSIYRSYNGKRGKHLPRGLADTFFLSMIEFMGLMGLEDSVLVCYGELLYERGELEQAEQYLNRGLQGKTYSRYQPEKAYVPASLFLSRIAKARQDFSQAEKWLEEAARRTKEDGAEGASILIDAELAALRLDQGDPTAAIQWKEQYRLSPDDPVSVYQLFVYQFLVRVLIETGNLQEAWTLSEKLLQVAAKGHRPMDALEIEVLQAIMLRQANKQAEALLKLEEALKYAKPDDYVRVFADKGKPVAELLAEYIQQRQKGNIRDKDAPPLSYLRKILSAFRNASASVSREPTGGALETLLTPKEAAIFRYMEEGLTNAAIVEALGIGMGTLKAHINHIYGKLQAKSRMEAIKRGRELQG